jgi:hypothetical protein
MRITCAELQQEDPVGEEAGQQDQHTHCPLLISAASLLA